MTRYGGVGPALLLVHRAMSDHQRWRITPLLQPRRTAYAMDRRGRGGSGDAAEWSLDREVDDVVAVIEAATRRDGGPMDVLGDPLGGLLAPRVAPVSPYLRRLVLHEPAIDEAAQPDEVLDRMRRALDEGRRDDEDALPDSTVVVLEGQQHVADQMVPEEFARIVLRFLEPEDGRVN